MKGLCGSSTQVVVTTTPLYKSLRVTPNVAPLRGRHLGSTPLTLTFFLPVKKSRYRSDGSGVEGRVCQGGGDGRERGDGYCFDSDAVGTPLSGTRQPVME